MHAMRAKGLKAISDGMVDGKRRGQPQPDPMQTNTNDNLELASEWSRSVFFSPPSVSFSFLGICIVPVFFVKNNRPIKL